LFETFCYPPAFDSRIYPDKSRCISRFRYIRIYLDTSGINPGYIRDISRYIRIHPDKSGMYPDTSGYIRDISISEYIWIYLDISGIPRLGGSFQIISRTPAYKNDVLR
jgi:hypothetical protein